MARTKTQASGSYTDTPARRIERAIGYMAEDRARVFDYLVVLHAFMNRRMLEPLHPSALHHFSSTVRISNSTQTALRIIFEEGSSIRGSDAAAVRILHMIDRAIDYDEVPASTQLQAADSIATLDQMSADMFSGENESSPSEPDLGSWEDELADAIQADAGSDAETVPADNQWEQESDGKSDTDVDAFPDAELNEDSSDSEDVPDDVDLPDDDPRRTEAGASYDVSSTHKRRVTELRELLRNL